MDYESLNIKELIALMVTTVVCFVFDGQNYIPIQIDNISIDRDLEITVYDRFNCVPYKGNLIGITKEQAHYLWSKDREE